MALIWMDGFDHYGDGDIWDQLSAAGYQWVTPWDGNAHPVTAASSRYGRGKCIKITCGGAIMNFLRNETCLLRPLTGVSGVAMGAAFLRTETNPDLAVFSVIVGGKYFKCWLNADGTVTVSGGSINYTSKTSTYFYNVWNYVEFRVELGENGSVGVSVNGDVVLWEAVNFTSVGSTVDYAGLYANTVDTDTPYYSALVDDFYLVSLDSTSMGDMLGTVAVVTRMPSSDVGPNTMDVTGAVEHYAAVSETPPDGDQSYLSGATPGQQEMFGLPTLDPLVIEVLAVSVLTNAYTDPGNQTHIQAQISLNNQLASGPVLRSGSGYTYMSSTFLTAPDGSAWDRTKAANVSVGVAIVK